MADVKDWSTTAGNNDQAPPDGFPEGMLPSGVNDGTREMMRALRQFANDLPWFEWGDGDQGYTASYMAADKFKIEGVNAVSTYYPGRRVRVVAPTPGTIYGGITTSSFAGGDTEVEVAWDSDGLSSESITSVALAMGQAEKVGGLEWVRPPSIISSQSEVVIGGDLLALYDPIQIHISGFRPASNDTNLAVQVSTTSGAPWVSANYKYAGGFWQSDNDNPTAIRGNGSSQIVFTNAVGNGANDRVSGLIEMRNHWETARTMFTSNLTWRASNADGRSATVGGWTEAGVHQAVRVYFTTGDITDGEIVVTGARRS